MLTHNYSKKLGSAGLQFMFEDDRYLNSNVEKSAFNKTEPNLKAGDKKELKIFTKKKDKKLHLIILIQFL